MKTTHLFHFIIHLVKSNGRREKTREEKKVGRKTGKETEEREGGKEDRGVMLVRKGVIQEQEMGGAALRRLCGSEYVGAEFCKSPHNADRSELTRD